MCVCVCVFSVSRAGVRQKHVSEISLGWTDMRVIEFTPPVSTFYRSACSSPEYYLPSVKLDLFVQFGFERAPRAPTLFLRQFSLVCIHKLMRILLHANNVEPLILGKTS